MKLKLLMLLLPLLLSGHLHAGNQTKDLKCVAKNASHIDEQGSIVSVKDWKFYLNREFTIDRTSGVIVGSHFENNIADIKPTVFNHEVNGYSVVSSSNNQVVSYLQVNAFEKSEEKPFIYIMTNVVLTGICNYI